jgi:hypothetical protein
MTNTIKGLLQMQNAFLPTLSRTSEKVGLKIIMRLNTNAATNIEVGSEIIEEVEDFTYLGSIISGEEGVLKDVASRIARSNEILGWRAIFQNPVVYL